ncbi:MAG: hypothetical protein QOK26_2919 [Pseudonocardiales bacterium]|jgi:acetyl esterase/lipase|nr:hypothetical protein [Pseudonocardiales bacterium]
MADKQQQPYLGASGLAEAGRRYAGEMDVRDPRVSPLFGALTGLPPTTVFIGTRDVLLSDAGRLRDKARTVGGGIDYLEHPGMIHNWPMRRIPEGRRALHRIAEQLATQPDNAGEPRQPLDSRWPAYRRAPR